MIEQIFLSIQFVKLCMPATKLEEIISILDGGVFRVQYESSPTSPTIADRLKYIPISLLYEIGTQSN